MRFHEERFAAEYHGRLKREGYPGPLLPAVLDELSGVQSLIDAGGGSGFFAVPIAEHGIRVTVVDPAVPMTIILERTIVAEKLSNIRISNETWESWPAARHDAVLSAHSLYPMSDQAAALRKMISCADKRVVIVRDDDGQLTLGDAVRQRFSSPRSVKNLAPLIESVVISEGLSFRKIPVQQRAILRLDDLKREADYYLFFLDLPSGSADEIYSFLKQRCVPRSGIYEFESLHSDFIYVF